MEVEGQIVGRAVLDWLSVDGLVGRERCACSGGRLTAEETLEVIFDVHAHVVPRLIGVGIYNLILHSAALLHWLHSTAGPVVAGLARDAALETAALLRTRWWIVTFAVVDRAANCITTVVRHAVSETASMPQRHGGARAARRPRLVLALPTITFTLSLPSTVSVPSGQCAMTLWIGLGVVGGRDAM